jgi:hypothetical protein
MGSVMNDEHPGCNSPLKHRKQHQTVNHSRSKYQRQNQDGPRTSPHTAESFFSLLKHAIIGAWHHISRERLPKYANEFAFRWNTRQDNDGKRLERFARWIEGKRLMYRQVSQPLCVC